MTPRIAALMRVGIWSTLNAQRSTLNGDAESCDLRVET
jgi:hypothetical protein